MSGNKFDGHVGVDRSMNLQIRNFLPLFHGTPKMFSAVESASLTWFWRALQARTCL